MGIDVQEKKNEDFELYLNSTWRPFLTVTGAEGLPNLVSAGNVLRPETSIKLSIRVPPNISPEIAGEALIKVLKDNTPYGAKVELLDLEYGYGWMCPDYEPWLEKAIKESSEAFYGKEACFIAEGGSIPFMKILGVKYPKAQFAVIGVAGPYSNAHGPNECLDIEYCKKLTCCVSIIVAKHFLKK